MGNSTSNASNPQSKAIRGASPAPTPGVPHPSLRSKKKSLELPDLASLSLDNTRGRQAKSASIPIPITPPSPFRHYHQSQNPHPRAPRHLPSTADVDLVANYPPFPRPNPAPRGRQQQQQVARMQELYNQSQQPTHLPSLPRPFQQEIVRSSIPVALTKALPNELPLAEEIVQQEYPQKEDLLADFVPVKIVWKGGGTQVVLARASDDDWKGRQAMEKESANVWTLTVMLRPGTHHVRFLVDGQWRVADDLPAAVDDQGSLANYVAVPIPVLSSPPPAPPPPAPVTREKLLPGQSFWSADSSADGEYQSPPLQQQQQQQSHPHSHSDRWTNVFPPELIEAALEEEAYLLASAGHYEVSSPNTRVTTGFIPAPNIPPAPGLPRHLEKLILNTRVGAGLSGAAGTSAAAGVGTRSGSGQARGGVGSMGVGSGQGQAARNRDRDRDRERDRERERGERGMRKRATTAAASAVVNISPPAPPPSEDGSVPPSSRIVTASLLPETSLIDAMVVQSIDASSTTTPSSTSAPTISTSTSSPTSLPSTSIAPMSPIRSKDLSKTCGGSSENGNGTGASPTMSPTRSPTILHSSASTSAPASATNSATASATTSATASPNPSTNPTTPVATPPHASPPASHFSPSAHFLTPTGSRTITIDSTNMPSLSDDGSVLPVPSHVVLHHLSTSAIRNGVLAVGNTIRYRKKYLTTIYYKPT